MALSIVAVRAHKLGTITLSIIALIIKELHEDTQHEDT
jgi:hypothetical protein